MQTIRGLLEKNPDLLKFDSVDPEVLKKRQRYEQIIEDDFDKLDAIAQEVQALVMTMQHWRLEAGEKVFEFGKAITREYDLNLTEINQLFNIVLPKWSRGPLVGFFISGTYHEIIGEADELFLDLTRYPGSISGIGFKHPLGKLELFGNRTFFLGIKMTAGKIVLQGLAGNHIGKYLQGGEIIVKGNARNWIGHRMDGGSITIEGNAGDVIGKNMTGGEILIEGNAGGWVGDGMKNGVIRVKGECGLIDESRPGGSIFEWREEQWVEVGL